MRMLSRGMAMIAILSLFLPWITLHAEIGSWVSVEKDYSFIDILKALSDVSSSSQKYYEHYANPNVIKVLEKAFSYLGDHYPESGDIELRMALFIIGLLLISVGAFIPLITGGRGGHITGLIGVIFFGYGIWPVVSNKYLGDFISLSVGYLLAGIAFFVGAVFGGSFRESKTRIETKNKKVISSELSQDNGVNSTEYSHQRISTGNILTVLGILMPIVFTTAIMPFWNPSYSEGSYCMMDPGIALIAGLPGLLLVGIGALKVVSTPKTKDRWYKFMIIGAILLLISSMSIKAENVKKLSEAAYLLMLAMFIAASLSGD
jgi:hypothetical protein